MIFDAQFNPAHCPWPRYIEAARAADRSHIDTLWTLDHLSGSVFGGDGMLECFSLLGALSVATTRIRLGSLVVNVALRQPGVLAAAASSVQVMSGGRFTLGLGAGAGPSSPFATEHAVVGTPLEPTVAARHRTLARHLDLLDAQWAPGRSEAWDGFPLPEPRPGVIVGVNTRALAAIAGSRTDGVNVRAGHPDRAGILAAARDALSASDRPSRQWTSSVWSTWDESLFDPQCPERGALERDGVDRIILVPAGAPDLAAIARVPPPG